MRTFVLAALFGLAAAEISELQKQTVREMKEKIQAGKLDELNQMHESSLNLAEQQQVLFSEEEMETQREIRRELERTFGDLEELGDDVKEDLEDYRDRVGDAKREFRSDFENFKRSREEVRNKWKAAWENAEKNVKHESGEPFDRIYLDNDQQVVQQFKNADDFERRQNAEFERDFRSYMDEVNHAKRQLHQKQEEDWKPQTR